MPFSRYPSFQSFFEPHPALGPAPYLALLNPSGRERDLSISLDLCRSSVEKAGEAVAVEIKEMLRDSWRPQLVGAAALLVSDPSPQDLTELWRALDAATWSFVAPQLAVTAKLLDPDFLEKARIRLERKGERNPVGARWNDDPKFIGAFVALVGLDNADWLPSVLAAPEILAALQKDRLEANGGRIAIEWLGTLSSILHDS